MLIVDISKRWRTHIESHRGVRKNTKEKIRTLTVITWFCVFTRRSRFAYRIISFLERWWCIRSVDSRKIFLNCATWCRQKTSTQFFYLYQTKIFLNEKLCEHLAVKNFAHIVRPIKYFYTAYTKSRSPSLVAKIKKLPHRHLSRAKIFLNQALSVSMIFFNNGMQGVCAHRQKIHMHTEERYARKFLLCIALIALCALRPSRGHTRKQYFLLCAHCIVLCFLCYSSALSYPQNTLVDISRLSMAKGFISSQKTGR